MAAAAPAPAQVHKVCLVSIDGWGLGKDYPGNAIQQANTPVMDAFATNPEFLHAQLDASGLAVGLPEGVMGNSEVGHLTMGCGRVDYQDLVKINLSVKDATLASNPVLVEALNKAKAGGRLHFQGLVQDGGVHGHIEHLFALLKIAKQAGVPSQNCFVHFFTDGRDTPPQSATKYLKQLQDFLKQENYARISTVVGRYYAMDRDNRWDRIQIAYDALVDRVGTACKEEELEAAFQNKYANGESDEFFKPIITVPDGNIRDNDVVVCFNYRSDRMREICTALCLRRDFECKTTLSAIHLITMTQYDSKFPFPVLFKPTEMSDILAEWLSKRGLTQYHTAETEKFAHVTFFFNGGREEPFHNETRKMVPSPKVPTYDLAPAMSAELVRDSVIEGLATGYDFVMCNLAPPDMVGHTGVLKATIEACSVTDAVIGAILKACQRYGYTLVITSDHGNAEEMLDDKGDVQTKHSHNFVPLNIASPPSRGTKLTRQQGGLSDVAPTVLALMGLPIPPAMTGTSMVTTSP